MYGDGTNRFIIWLDLDTNDDLRATVVGTGGGTYILTSGGTGQADYHDFDIVYDPGTGTAAFMFDGQRIDGGAWTGQANTTFTGVQWGTGSSGGQGSANFHSVTMTVYDQTATTAAGGTVTNNGDGTVEYTPAASYSGPDTFTYAITDGNGNTADTNVSVTVTPNVSPVITSNGGGTTSSIGIIENTTLVTTVTATDGDGDQVEYTISGGADAALFDIDRNTGALTFLVAPDFEAAGDANGDNVYEVVVTADDQISTPDTQTINVTVTNANDNAPIAVDDAYSVDEDGTLTVDWWDSEWAHRQQLTFDNLAQSETLTDFPVLVVLNSGNIDYAQTNDDGSDLRFFAADGTQLAYEIEQWNESGDSSVWVRVPQITGSSNTDSIWMYYGNAAASPQSSAEDVWDSSFAGVWHLNEEQAGTGNGGVYQDSTGNGNDGVDRVAAIGQDGQVTDGQELGANDWIEIDHDPSLDLRDSMTISFWIKQDSASGTFNRVVEKGLWGYNDSYYFGGVSITNWPFR